MRTTKTRASTPPTRILTQKPRAPTPTTWEHTQNPWVPLNSASARSDAASTMSRRFLPVRESELDDWLANFASQIAASPGKYGLTTGDAAEISSAVDAWHAAFLAAAAPSTRTVATVQTKRNAKAAVTAVVRSAAARIRSNATVASDLKIGLGLVLRSHGGSPVPPPETRPVLGLRSMNIGVHTLDARDAAATRGGKPDRTTGLVVFRAVGDRATVTPEGTDGLTYMGLFTRLRFESAFTAADRGKTATYFARWVNAKGEAGPWSQGLSVAIAA